ncbi:hypothetical protein OPIT5_01745 [Opitutaceae bacterium TAV5]|nr:hypothetical protein OPIT5_01745 [Opitutaceae bacterium TAV5]
MFRLGRGSFAGALPPPTPAALAPFPDFCSLVLANSASLEITGSGHLCLGGVTGSGNEVIVHSGSTLVTPRIHLGGMQARATTSPDLTDDNRVLVTGAGSTLTVGNAGLLIAWPTVGTITDLPVYRNNLTIVDGATATVNGPINISSHGSDPITGTVRENNIRIGSGSSLSWSGQTSAAALQSLVDRGYILFKDNYIETVYGPPGLLNEPSVRWLTETQVISGTVGSVSVTFDAGTGIATVSYTEY